MPAFVIALLLASPFINYTYLWGYKEFKSAVHITDPTDPSFRTEDFDAANYAFKSDLGETLRKMFPPQTPRTVVDRILVTSAHAKVLGDGESKDGVNVFYAFPERTLPLPQPTIRWCGTMPGHSVPDPYWRFWVVYSHPSKPGDTNSMLLETITWTTICD